MACQLWVLRLSKVPCSSVGPKPGWSAWAGNRGCAPTAQRIEVRQALAGWLAGGWRRAVDWLVVESRRGAAECVASRCFGVGRPPPVPALSHHYQPVTYVRRAVLKPKPYNRANNAPTGPTTQVPQRSLLLSCDRCVQAMKRGWRLYWCGSGFQGRPLARRRQLLLYREPRAA